MAKAAESAVENDVPGGRADSPRPAHGVRQARPARVRAGPPRPRHRDRLDRRHRARARRGRRGDEAGGGLHRLPRDPRRARQDAEPADLRRAPGGSLGRGARGHAEGEGDRADRPRVREPLPVRAHRGPARRERRGDHREHRHRWAHAHPGRGQEPSVRGRGGVARGLRRCARRAPHLAGPPLRAHPRAACDGRVRLHGAVRRGDLTLVRRARGGVPGAVHARRGRRCSTSPMARTRTSVRPTTRRSGRAPTCSRWSRSCTARSCRSTICSTSTRGGTWSTSSRCPPRRSSSTTTRAARPSGARPRRHSTGRWPPTRRARSVGSSASTGRSRRRWPRS